MKTKKIVLLGAAALLSVGAGVLASKTVNVKNEPRDTRIMIELQSSLPNKSEKGIRNEQNIILNRIRNEVTSNFTIVERFSNVVNAITLDVSAGDVSAIRNVAGVKKVEYDTMRYVQYKEDDLAVSRSSIVSAATDNISKETMNIPDDTNEGEGTLIAVLDTGFMINATYKDGTEENPIEWENVTHKAFTALDESVSVRYTQDSLRAIIDAHEEFHGQPDDEHSTYWNNKVPFYYDYGGAVSAKSGESYGAGEEDYDVFTTVSEHGNHVATIAAGNDPLYKGIAPKAQLALMKVFTDVTITYEDGTTNTSTGAFDSALLKAFEDCAIIKPDVINMSLGSDLNDFFENEILSDAVKNLKQLGSICSISAGNAGKEQFAESAYEYWTTDMVDTGILGYETTHQESMIIASSEADKEYYDTALKVGNSIVAFHDQIQNTSSSTDYTVERKLTDLLVDNPTGQFKWVKIPGWGEASDFNSLVKDDVDPVNGAIAIIDRGEINFSVKISNAQTHGAIAVGIIDNDPTATEFNFRMDLGGMQPKVPVFSILFRDKTTFDDAATDECLLLSDVIESNPTARSVSDFTSDGATYDLHLVPDIMTPGTKILGGVYEGGPSAYEYFSGTSMAAPNFSGAYALMLSEHLDDPSWRATLEDRLMSSAVPSMDKYNENYVTPRRQGAGLVDITKALATEVVLDGSADSDNLLGKAKIELLNNEFIKNGQIKLDFTSISSASSSIVYNAKLSIFRPGTGSLDSSRFGDIFKDVVLMSNVNALIKNIETTITIAPGKQVNSISYNLTAEEKAAIDAIYPDGCYIEGYVELTATDVTPISIPYMGFYGDHSAGLAVEPFKFERDNSKVYPSDIVNNLLHKWAGKTYADFGSDWIMGNWESMEDIDLTDYVLNDKGLRNLVDSNMGSVIPVGTNPYTGKYETKDIYMGNNGKTNTMIIQQFVMRSVETNTLTITNKATGKVVLTDHMFDSLFGAKEDDEGNDIAWPLYKSFMDPDYWGTYYGHRAYTIIPLYEYEYNETKKKYIIGDDFPDGEYEIKFDYTLAQGKKFEKSYTLHIDSNAPQIKSVQSFQKDGEDFLRVYFDELKMSYVAVSGVKNTIKEDDNGYYVDIKVSDYAKTNKAYFKGYDFAYGISNTLMKTDDPNFVTITSQSISNAYDFTQNIRDIDGKSMELSFSFMKGSKSVLLNEDMRVTINLSKLVAENSDFVPKAYLLKEDGSKELCSISFDVSTNTLAFEGNGIDTFIIEYRLEAKPVDPVDPEGGDEDPEEPVEPSEPTKKGGCGGSIIAGSAIISITAALGASLLMFKKRKER